jgi:HlyD family secretion protein
MSASADIQTKTKSNVLSVPINAVTTRDKKVDSSQDKSKGMADATNETQVNSNNGFADNDLDVVVFVLQADGTVRKQIVGTGVQDINNIEITSGLKEGEEVVTGPYDVVSKTLKPKDKVKVVAKSELFEGKK